MKKILIVGATSAIAQETAKCFAGDGADLFLAGRNEDKLRAVAADLKVRGAGKAEVLATDLNDCDRHPLLIERAVEALGGLDAALLAHGTLGDQEACERDFNAALAEFRTNFLSAASLLTLLANLFERQGHGCLAAISSVAGDRARQSNYVYGTAKGALSLFLQGLRNRLHRRNVRVLTVKPGFVDTPMTAHLKKNPLFASPKTVGRRIHRAMLGGKDVVYIPSFWRIIMLAIRMIPERVFKTMRL